MKSYLRVIGAAAALSATQTAAFAATYNVRNAPYNATGNGSTDDRAAIQAAINAAASAGPNNTVYIPAGTYALNSSAATSWQTFYIPSNASGLTILGDGSSTLLLSNGGNREIFYLDHCANCNFQNFNLDQKVPNLTQGTITAVNTSTNSVTVSIDAGYPAPNTSFLMASSGYTPSLLVLTDPKRSTYTWSETPQINSVASAGSGKWTVNLGSTPSSSDVNKKFFIWGSNSEGWMFNIQGCNNVTVQNVNDYSAQGFYVNRATGTLSFTNFYIGSPPGSNRLGLNSGMQGVSRADLVMTGCSILQSNDDAVNQLTGIDHILAKPAPSTVQVSGGGDYQPGDTVCVWDYRNPASPYIRATAHIVSTHADGANLDVVLDADVQIVNVGPQPTGPGNPQVAQQSDGIDRLCDLSGGAITLTNSTFVSSFARPLLVKSAKSLTITGCNILGGDQDGIEAGMETYWGEGPQCKNVTIKNNTFSDMDGCSVDIGIFATNGPSGLSHDQTNIDIENNLFQNGGQHAVWNDVMPRGIALRLANASGATVKNNTFKNFSNANIAVLTSDNVNITGNNFVNPHQTALPVNRSQGAVDPGAVIWIDNSQNVSLSNNVVFSPGSHETALAEATANNSGINGLSTGVYVSSGVPVGHRIALKSAVSGKYVSVNLYGGDPNQNDLQAAFADSAQGWEMFDVVDAGGGNIALKSEATGKYVTVDLNQSSKVLRADLATVIQAWETMNWVDQGGGVFGLKSGANGLYVSCNNGAGNILEAQWAQSISTWEQFTWVDAGKF
ncbi:hypothetical protein CCAX7_11050 [Capsulimonas corticalis]|uniref:Uncharacterized protein n=1 Tax=Capsulimonas corticalis TaxID=2219043 RepID=A0A402CUR4_9BACT|nr:right-handed parallel beta-helix repeat-containing protein [Capsulimonas corticalis]BDI29054.1 hypothetical protein CCAX7_11050 [Capsulimonas corticalis]